MESNKIKYIGIGIFILIFIIILIGIFASVGKGDDNKMSIADAKSTLDAYLSKVKIDTVSEQKPDIDTNGISDAALPDINKYPLSVEGKGEINIEIFASTEKSGDGTDGWINEVAKKFNNSNQKVNGKKVTVSIRPIASGLALDYLQTGKYLPDAYTPANNLWIDMLEAKNIKVTKIEEKLVGNTAGILLKEDKYNLINDKYGEVTLETILKANKELDVMIGYTNPYASSTGLNMLVSMLNTFDNTNPLSSDATNELVEFQKNSPPVALTTSQMRNSAAAGIIDVMTMEYQAYINEPKLSSYKYIPMGVRHDSPLYATKELTDEQIQVLKLFGSYCKNTESQDLANRYGFNQYNEYKSAASNLTGAQLYTAQSVWKANKDGGRPIIAVFVADVSGSMEGAPINSLRNGLVGSSQYISDTNYIGLVSYSDNVRVELPIAQFTGNQRALFNGSVKRLSAGGSTNTYTALLQAIKIIEDSKSSIPDARTAIFLLSDGDSNRGYSFSKVKNLIDAFGIPVHCISYNEGSSELTALSEINEASKTDADSQDISYQLKQIFNSQM